MVPSDSSAQSSPCGSGFTVEVTRIPPSGDWVIVRLNFGVLKKVAVSTFRVARSKRTRAAESGGVGNCGRRFPELLGGGRNMAKFGGARYTSLPFGSNPGL